MARNMTMTEAKKALTTLPEKLSRRKRALAVTRDGLPVLAVMPWGDYQAMLETMEILSDKEAMRAIRQSEKDIKAGRLYSGKEVKRSLKL